MKVLMISGSPHKAGSSRLALDEMKKVFEAEGVETELIEVGAGPISGCTACGACKKTGVCVIDDMVNEAIKRLEAADALVVATPVHYASPAGALLAFLDRMFYAGGSKFAHKPAAALACARRAGTTASVDVMNKYFTISQMPVVSSTYWNGLYGVCPEAAAQDAEGLQTARNLARNMAWLIKCIEAGRAAGFPAPTAERGNVTNFIR
ncbi:MAG TPA: flavodoxin family protein [Candidatus Scatomorpha pullistercoris]|uniref:Flavodoxin family protein n=1 Tax=Candidatus Scatomorpha pullistercoris TaxID=2840929 RepID=A0A9D1G4X6_9FIRM|nr:flavodoxin family protein [Candidatus Scatomorpha pullistercoris]